MTHEPEMKSASRLTLRTGMRYSATPNAVPFTELMTLCIFVKFLYISITMENMYDVGGSEWRLPAPS